VCLNENTADPYYSGADFRRGVQQIDAAQAMAFVRQRRDPHPALDFTDLDRTRRQQAFIVSVARKLQDTGTLADVGTVTDLLAIAERNLAIDVGLDLPQFAAQASDLMSGGLSLYTLPIEEFATTSGGEDVNLVDPAGIRTIVRGLLGPADPGASTAPAAAGPSAAEPGTPASGPAVPSPVSASASPSATAAPGSTASTPADPPAASQPISATAAPSPAAPPLVSATAPGAAAPGVTDLSSMDAGGIPCVK
jgi:hypothetical protein